MKEYALLSGKIIHKPFNWSRHFNYKPNFLLVLVKVKHSYYYVQRPVPKLTYNINLLTYCHNVYLK